MKRPNRLISSLILFFTFWALLFSVANYVSCDDLYPDEFLDIALGCQKIDLAALILKGIICPAFFSILNIYALKRSTFFTPALRC
jgi:hypothetical protein